MACHRQRKLASLRFRRHGESCVYAPSLFLPKSNPLRWVLILKTRESGFFKIASPMWESKKKTSSELRLWVYDKSPDGETKKQSQSEDFDFERRSSGGSELSPHLAEASRSEACFDDMVGLAQLAEHRIVVPGVVGSSPISHPTENEPRSAAPASVCDYIGM